MSLITRAKSMVLALPTKPPSAASPNPTDSSKFDTTLEVYTTSRANKLWRRTSWRFSTLFTNGAGHDVSKYPLPEDTGKSKERGEENRYSSIYLQESRAIMVKQLRDERRGALVFGFDMVNRLFTTEEEKEEGIVEEAAADDNNVGGNEIQMPSWAENNRTFTPRTKTNLSPFLGTELRKEYVLKKTELEKMTRQVMDRRGRTKFLVGGVRETFEELGKMKTEI